MPDHVEATKVILLADLSLRLLRRQKLQTVGDLAAEGGAVMLSMEPRDRQELTSGLLRVILSSQRLCQTILRRDAHPTSSWAARMSGDYLNAEPGWDRNHPFKTIRLALQTSTGAALEHGFALFELSRSKRALAVPLATVTRGAIEAFGRAYWLLEADTMAELVRRAASLEYYDMEYPAKFGLKLRRLPVETVASIQVGQYREELSQWLNAHGLSLVRWGSSALATQMLDASYGKGRLVYSDLSAVAHGKGWATANFYNFDTSALQRDDEILIGYCKFVIEAARTVTERLVARFEPAIGEVERWKQTLQQVDETLAEFISPTSERHTPGDAQPDLSK